MPEVIPITDFRRDAARIIASHIAAERPVYITQCGFVTAVVLSPERYRGLARLAEQGLAAERGRAAGRGRAASGRVGARAADADGNGWSEDVFGFLDADTAEILASGGFELE